MTNGQFEKKSERMVFLVEPSIKEILKYQAKEQKISVGELLRERCVR